MKILHINYTLTYGGIETMLVNLANEQIKNGNEVYIIIFWNLVSPELISKLDKRINVIFINRPQGSVNPIYLIRLNYYLKKLRPDVCHLHSAKLVDYIFLPSILRKCCVTQHRECNGVGSDRLRKIKYRYAISNTVKTSISQTYNLQAYTIYNGIKPELFEYGKLKYSSKDNLFHIIQLGRLIHEEKGQHILIDAIKILVQLGYNNFLVDFVGDGPSLSFLQKLVKEKRIEGYVRFLGPKAQEYLYENLCKYDLLVQPSIYEGFGLTVIESMAAKVPVLVANSKGPMEVISNGKYGYYFETRNPEDLASKLQTIFDKGVDINIVNRAFDVVYSVYNISNTADLYIEEYSKFGKND